MKGKRDGWKKRFVYISLTYALTVDDDDDDEDLNRVPKE